MAGPTLQPLSQNCCAASRQNRGPAALTSGSLGIHATHSVQQYQFEIYFRYLILQRYEEHETTTLVMTEASTVCLRIQGHSWKYHYSRGPSGFDYVDDPGVKIITCGHECFNHLCLGAENSLTLQAKEEASSAHNCEYYC